MRFSMINFKNHVPIIDGKFSKELWFDKGSDGEIFYHLFSFQIRVKPDGASGFQLTIMGLTVILSSIFLSSFLPKILPDPEKDENQTS